jgi:DNA-binding SARP family transcriptional activator
MLAAHDAVTAPPSMAIGHDAHLVRLLGGASVHSMLAPDVGCRLQRRPLAVLAIIVVAGARGCSRARLVGLLWPDDDEPRARHHLSDALSAVRQELGPLAIHVNGDQLAVNERAIRSDVGLFEDALRQGRLADAAELYQGPLLDGFYLPCAGDFDQWVGAERDRLAGAYAVALERLAAAAENPCRAAAWLRRLVAHDPFDSPAVLKLAAALEAAGDRANALRCVEEHERRLERELEIAPDAAVLRALQRLRAPLAVPLAAPPAMPLAEAHTDGAEALPVAVVAARDAATSPPRWRERRRYAVAAAAIALIAVGARALLTSPPVTAERWMVTPFAVAGATPELRRMAADLPLLAEMHLPGPPGPYVHRRAMTAGLWARAGGDSALGPSEDEIMRIAQRAGAGRVLLGTLANEAGRVMIVMRLLTVPRGDHRGVAVGSCPPESTAVLLRRMLDALRAREARLPPPPS